MDKPFFLETINEINITINEINPVVEYVVNSVIINKTTLFKFIFPSK